MELNAFKLEVTDYIAQLSFNIPQKANSLDEAAWVEMESVMKHLSDRADVRVVILSGEGKHFCAGIDLATLMSQNAMTITCEARKRESLRKFITKLQNTITAIEKCSKPVIAAIHNGCIGGAVDIIAACDMRYCTDDAYFTIKETDLGLVADIGTMQRLPTILNPGRMAEMAYTGRKVYGPEAKAISLVNEMYSDKDTMMEEVTKLAANIATKSPLVIRGIKEMLLYKRDHTVQDSLDYMATYNAAMLLSRDLMEAFQANMQKRDAVYKD